MYSRRRSSSRDRKTTRRRSRDREDRGSRRNREGDRERPRDRDGERPKEQRESDSRSRLASREVSPDTQRYLERGRLADSRKADPRGRSRTRSPVRSGRTRDKTPERNRDVPKHSYDKVGAQNQVLKNSEEPIISKDAESLKQILIQSMAKKASTSPQTKEHVLQKTASFGIEIETLNQEEITSTDASAVVVDLPVAIDPEIEAAAEKLRKRKEKLELWKKDRAIKEASQAIQKNSLKDESPEKVKQVAKAKSFLTFGTQKKKTTFTSSAVVQSLTSKVISSNQLTWDDDIGADVLESKELADYEINYRKVDADETPEVLEEEEDPLDAFMLNVENTVQIQTAKDLEILEKERASQSSTKLQSWIDENIEGDEVEQEVDRPIEFDREQIMQDAFALNHKKEFLQTDHSTVEYETFRKDFYIEPPDVKALTALQADLKRIELDGIKIRGARCPKPVERWSQFGMPPGVDEVIKKVLKYDRPSPIQSQAIPAILSGRDVIGIARTGSGKTLAFLLPMFRHLKDQRPCRGADGPIAIIMTPTRELAVQIYRECKVFTKFLNLRAVCCYGGTPIKDQIADLKRGTEIIICTPGRILDLLCANGGRVTNLRRVTYMVLDEADRMFDLGFEPQVMKLVNNVRPDRQSLLFSATFPKKMEALARKILTKPLEITVGARSVVCADVTQIVEVHANDDSKFLRLLSILGETANVDEYGKTLIFVDRQDAADGLLSNLMRRSYPCSSIHGGKDQSDRDQTIADFKAGNINILIATSIAARGLDVKDLINVINYECPNHMEDYVHRCGRTGRAGKTGTAYTFITPDQERFTADIIKALTASKTAIPFDLREMAENFEAKIRLGSATTIGSGFGGKGLSQLEFHREVLKFVQKRSHGQDLDEVEEDEPSKIIQDGETDNEAASMEETTNAAMSLIVVNPRGITAAIAAAKERAKDKFRIMTEENAASTARNAAESAFSASVVINDYPQTARWKVTNKEFIQKTVQISGASVTVRGSFVAPGKQPLFNEPKLHLFIEADNSFAIERAKSEIKTTLTEGAALSLTEGYSY